jgi:hypothetical protein
MAAAVVALLLMSFGSARAQQNRLDCRGVLGDTPATLSGIRVLAPNMNGGGDVQFQGVVTAGGSQGTIAYGGSAGLIGRIGGGPMPGVIQAPVGTIPVGVLDNTGGEMIIYSGKASLGPPNILGRFRCAWH